MYATRLDESLNKTLKAACKHTSHVTFEAVVPFFEKPNRQAQAVDQLIDDQERVPKMKHCLCEKTWKNETNTKSTMTKAPQWRANHHRHDVVNKLPRFDHDLEQEASHVAGCDMV